MNKKKKIFFFRGIAGTGKSFYIEEIKKICNDCCFFIRDEVRREINHIHLKKGKLYSLKNDKHLILDIFNNEKHMKKLKIDILTKNTIIELLDNVKNFDFKFIDYVDSNDYMVEKIFKFLEEKTANNKKEIEKIIKTLKQLRRYIFFKLNEKEKYAIFEKEPLYRMYSVDKIMEKTIKNCSFHKKNLIIEGNFIKIEKINKLIKLVKNKKYYDFYLVDFNSNVTLQEAINNTKIRPKYFFRYQDDEEKNKKIYQSYKNNKKDIKKLLETNSLIKVMSPNEALSFFKKIKT